MATAAKGAGGAGKGCGGAAWRGKVAGQPGQQSGGRVWMIDRVETTTHLHGNGGGASVSEKGRKNQARIGWEEAGKTESLIEGGGNSRVREARGGGSNGKDGRVG